MSGATAGSGRDWQQLGNRWLIAVVVTLAAFMEVLDTTIVNVALPHIAGSMASSEDEATWALTSYLVANGIVLVISGYLGRLLGRKRYFLHLHRHVHDMLLAVWLCTEPPGAGRVPLPARVLRRRAPAHQQAIILDTFKPAQRAGAFAVTAIATIVAPVIGPTLGGWITDNYSWRWVFLPSISPSASRPASPSCT